MGLLIIAAIGFALWASLRHGREDRQKSRKNRLKEIARQMPGGIAPKAARRRNALVHDSAWWAREIAHGFPVHRTGWHAGWLVHSTEALQQKAVRDEARASHENVRQSYSEARARRREALDQVEHILDAPDAPKQAVREAVGQVLPFPDRMQPEAPGVAPEADAGSPPPGPETGYEGPLNRDPRVTTSADGDLITASRPLTPQEQQWAAEDHARLRELQNAGQISGPGTFRRQRGPGGRVLSEKFTPEPGPYRSDHGKQGGDGHPVSAAASGGVPVTTGTTETTYSQTNAALDKIVSESEAEIARLRARQVGQLVEAVGTAGVGGSVLGHLADIDDGVQKQIAAAQQQLDSAQAAKAAHIRDHGQGHEYHSGAAGGGAEKSYLQE
jgi:hypothetical protein